MKTNKKDNYEIPTLEQVKNTNELLNSGIDPISSIDDDTRIPDVINHTTYGVGTLVKPLVVLSNEAYDNNNLKVSDYYEKLQQLIRCYNRSMFDQYTKYYINRYINQVLQNIQQDIKNTLDKNGIQYMKVELFNSLYDFPKKAYEIFNSNLALYELDVIEQMASLYIKDIADDNKENIALSGMEMIEKIFSPYVTVIVNNTVFELYNRVISYIHNVLLYDIIIDDRKMMNLKSMDTIEKSLTDEFNATAAFLKYNYNIMIMNCFFSRTTQDYSITD